MRGKIRNENLSVTRENNQTCMKCALTLEKIVQQIRPAVNLLLLLRIVEDHRALRRFVRDGPETETRTRSDARLVQLPFRFRVAERGEQSLHTDGEQSGQDRVEDGVENQQGTYARKKHEYRMV